MALHVLQQRYLNRFYPGLVTAVDQLGPATFEPNNPVFKTAGPTSLRYVGLALNARLPDGYRIEIAVQLSILPGRTYVPERDASEVAVDLTAWKLIGYALHYGTPAKDCVFRFDLHDPFKHHVHMKPDTDDHIPADDVLPNTRDMNPRDFVRIVAEYRANQRYPLQRIR